MEIFTGLRRIHFLRYRGVIQIEAQVGSKMKVTVEILTNKIRGVKEWKKGQMQF